MDERYSNTQRGIIRPLLASLGIGFLALAYFFGMEFLIPALLMYLLSFVFGQLTVEEQGDRLVIHYGPLPLLRTSVRYVDIISAEPFQGSSLRKLCSWNVGGSERVRIVTNHNALVVGTDDVEGLLEHLRAKIKARELLA